MLADCFVWGLRFDLSVGCALCANGRSNVPIRRRSSLAAYLYCCSSCSASFGTLFACVKTDVPAFIRMLCLVSSAVSSAISDVL